jgi:hypothetical protein
MKDISSDIKTTVGSFEYVSLPGLKTENVIAKIDTGAYSGAVHCTDIEEVKRKSDGATVLRFRPFDQQDNVIEVADYNTVKVRSSTGHQIKRYIIETDMILKQKQYTIRITLSDRSDMKNEVLIGRRFLRKNNMLVDVLINKELDTDGGGKI